MPQFSKEGIYEVDLIAIREFLVDSLPDEKLPLLVADFVVVNSADADGHEIVVPGTRLSQAVTVYLPGIREQIFDALIAVGTPNARAAAGVVDAAHLRAQDFAQGKFYDGKTSAEGLQVRLHIKCWRKPLRSMPGKHIYFLMWSACSFASEQKTPGTELN